MTEQVNFPTYWDTVKVTNAFATLTTFELYEFFGCRNAMSFSRLMKPIFPNKPPGQSYSQYANEIFNVPRTYAKAFTDLSLEDMPEVYDKYAKLRVRESHEY